MVTKVRQKTAKITLLKYAKDGLVSHNSPEQNDCISDGQYNSHNMDKQSTERFLNQSVQVAIYFGSVHQVCERPNETNTQISSIGLARQDSSSTRSIARAGRGCYSQD